MHLTVPQKMNEQGWANFTRSRPQMGSQWSKFSRSSATLLIMITMPLLPTLVYTVVVSLSFSMSTGRYVHQWQTHHPNHDRTEWAMIVLPPQQYHTKCATWACQHWQRDTSFGSMGLRILPWIGCCAGQCMPSAGAWLCLHKHRMNAGCLIIFPSMQARLHMLTLHAHCPHERQYTP